jgi:hypothetical protein
MALPKLHVTQHELTLPHSGQEIQFRALTVGEEKILAIAKSSENQKDIMSAIKQVIKRCTFDQVNPETIALVDFEFLFLNIRIRSKGEVADLRMRCAADECGRMVDVSVDLTASKKENFDTETKIDLGGDVGLKMKAPTLAVMKAMMNKKLNDFDQSLRIIETCIEYIYDEEGVYHLKDSSRKEIDAFMSSISSEGKLKIQEFMEKLPTIYFNVDYKCECGHDNHRVIKGIDNFF